MKQKIFAICDMEEAYALRMAEYMLEKIYYTAEGSLKSVNYNILQSLVRVTSLKTTADSVKLPGSVSSQLAYLFF